MVFLDRAAWFYLATAFADIQLLYAGRQPLSNNTAVLNSGAASSVPKSGKKRKRTSKVSKAYMWIDEKFGRKYRKYWDKGPWHSLIKKDADFKQAQTPVYVGLLALFACLLCVSLTCNHSKMNVWPADL